MNKHLNPVFTTVLPLIEKSNMPYWVFGGAAIAGIKGEYIRYNRDVDIFVENGDYANIITLVKSVIPALNWTAKDEKPLKEIRPKCSLFAPGSDKDIFSVIPFYRDNDLIEFIYPINIRTHSALTRNKTSVDKCEFYIPSKEFIKELFIHNIEYLINSGKMAKKFERKEAYEKDAKVILDKEEYDRYFVTK